MEEQLLNNLAPSEVLAKAAKPRLPIEQLQFLQMLAGKDPAILAQFGASAQVRDKKPHSLNSYSLMFLLTLLCLCMVLPPTPPPAPTLPHCPAPQPSSSSPSCCQAFTLLFSCCHSRPCPSEPTTAVSQCSPPFVKPLHYAGKDTVVLLCWQCQGPKTCECKRSVLHAVVELHVA